MSRRFAFFLLALLIIIPFINRGLREVTDSVWDGTHHINIAIDQPAGRQGNGDIEIWSIEPAEKHIAQLILPAATQFSVAPYGTYRGAALGKLSLLEKKDGTLFIQAIKETLGISLDAVILNRNENLSPLPLAKLSGFPNLLRGRYTNMSFFDGIRLWWLLTFALKPEAAEIVPVADLDVLTKITLPDQTEGFRVDKDRFATIAQKYFRDVTLANEAFTIEVVNATEVSGLANSTALLFTNMGGNVIATSKGEAVSEKTTVFAKKKSYTASKIAAILKTTISDAVPQESRVDIVVVLGER